MSTRDEVKTVPCNANPTPEQDEPLTPDNFVEDEINIFDRFVQCHVLKVKYHVLTYPIYLFHANLGEFAGYSFEKFEILFEFCLCSLPSIYDHLTLENSSNSQTVICIF